MKLKKKLEGRIFNVKEDWNDLFLVQRRLGLEVASRMSVVAEAQDCGDKCQKKKSEKKESSSGEENR